MPQGTPAKKTEHERLELWKDLSLLVAILLGLAGGANFVAAHNEVEAVRTTAHHALALLQTEIARVTPPQEATMTVTFPGYPPSGPPEAPRVEGTLPAKVLVATSHLQNATKLWTQIVVSKPDKATLEKLDHEINKGFGSLGLETRTRLADMLPTILGFLQVPTNVLWWGLGTVASAGAAIYFDYLQAKGPEGRAASTPDGRGGRPPLRDRTP